MKKVILVPLLGMFLTSCDSIFVWTFKDIAGLILLGIVGIFFGAIQVYIWIDRFRNRNK